MIQNYTKLLLALMILLGLSININAQCSGTITITTQAEIDNFSCTVFDGDLTIQDPSIKNLDALSELTAINGTLTILGTEVTNLDGLANLTTVDDITISENNLLTNLSLPELVDNGETVDYKGVNLDLESNQSLETIEFAKLEKGASISINNNVLATSVSFPELNQVGTLGLSNSNAIMAVDFPKLSIARVLTFTTNPKLESISFPELTRFYWELEELAHVFVLSDNAKLTSVSVPNFSTVSDAIVTIVSNPLLEEICDLFPFIQHNADFNQETDGVGLTLANNSSNTSTLAALEQNCIVCPSLELMQDATLCSGPLFLNANDYSKEITWSTNGEGTLTRLNQTQAEDSAYYFPSINEYNNGAEIELYASIESGTACGTLTDVVTVTINPKTTVDAGSDFFHLTNDAVSLNGSVNNANASIWETSGSGSFSDNTKTVTTYIPSEIDKAEGMVKFTLKVPQEQECPEVTDEVLVSLIDCQISIVEKIKNNDVELIAINANSKVITSYEWTLSDGKTRKGRVINHTYLNTGSYPVTVTSKSSDKLCNASASTNITIENTTVPTYSFSGNVEVNDNGSVSTLKEGEAILFYLSPLGVYQEKDRVLLNQNGEFTFEGLKEAEYYVAAAPIKSSGLYKRSILTYSPNTTNWADATSYIVDKDITNVNVEITTFTPTISNPNGGKDTLNGIVYLYANSTKKTSGGSRDIVDNPLPVQNAVMSLYNANGDLLQVTTTGESGGFELDELDPGVYSMEMSYTGTSVVIRQGIRIDGDPNTPEREVIGIPYEEVVASFDGTYSEELENTIYVAYPNPALTSVFISIPNVTGSVVYELLNNHGLVVKSGIRDVKNNCIELELIDLVEGIYFVTIENKTYKIIKR